MTVTRHLLSDDPVAAVRAAARRTIVEAAERLRGGLAGAGAGPARLHRQERHALGRPRASPAASTPPWSRRWPSTPSAPTGCTGSGCRRSGPASTRSPTPRTAAERLGLHYSVVPIAPMVDAYEAVGRPVRRRRGEPAGAGARHAAHGAVQPARAPAAGHEQQERGRRRLLDALRRRGRRVRADQGRAEDAGLGAGPLAQRGGPPPRRDRADPAELDRQAAVGRAAPPASRTATRCPPTRSSTPSSPTTSTATSAWRSCSSAGTTPRWSPRSSVWWTRAEFKRRQSAPGTKISLKAFGRDRRLPITNRWRETPAHASAKERHR